MPPQDPPSGYAMPDLPEDPATGPQLTSAVSAQNAPTVQAPQQGRFDMKPLGADYVEGEKNNAAQTVQMGGQEVEVHEKDWLRQMSNEDRLSKGQAPLTDAQWKANVATTQYMNDQQREEHQVGFKPAADETGAQNAKLKGDSMKRGEEHIFVMDGEGEVFAKEAQAALNQKDETGRGVHVHHSSFLAGEAVAGAGEMKIDDTGFLKEVTDRSGHYKPGEEQTQQTLGALEEKGVNLNNVKFTMDRGEEKIGGMAKEYQQGGEQVFKARHTMADEIKERGQNVREMLDQDASRRSTRVRKAEEHLENGMAYGMISEGAQQHAAKDAAGLKEAFKAEIKEQMKEMLDDKKPVLSVRDSMRASLGNKSSAPQYSTSNKL